MSKQEKIRRVVWQAVFGILLIGVIFLVFAGSGVEKIESPALEVMELGNGMKLVYYPPQSPGALGQTCFESTNQLGVLTKTCEDGKIDFNKILEATNESENEETPTVLIQEKSEAELEMENILSVLNVHLANMQNCITYSDSAAAANGDENQEAYWWSKYEDENCPTANESACLDLAKALEKRAHAPYWFSSKSAEYGKYLSTSNYDAVFKAYRDLGCPMEDVNIPQNQLSCLGQGIKIDEINEEAKKTGIKPNEAFTQYIQNHIVTCLK